MLCTKYLVIPMVLNPIDFIFVQVCCEVLNRIMNTRTKLNIKIKNQIIINTTLLSLIFNKVIISSITIHLYLEFYISLTVHLDTFV